MHFDADNLPLRRPAMVTAGHWRDLTANDLLDRAVADRPDAPALVAHRHATGAERTVTYGRLAAVVDRVAVGLHRLGGGTWWLCSFRTGGSSPWATWPAPASGR